ncbi:MAG: FAD-dependent oxidoreductase [Actinomycetota bacterium]
MRADVVVIGAGAMGSSTACHLARDGRDVVLLERFDRGHAWGSSHGATRIFRVSYRDSLYSRLAADAIPLWHQLESEAGETLLEQTGQLDHGFVRAIDEIERTLESGGWAFDRFTPQEAHERWPGMVFDTAVIYSPDGGRVFADRTVEAQISLAEHYGATVRFMSPARRIDRHGDGVRVHTDDESFEADAVVVAAGGWLEQVDGLADFGITLPHLEVTLQQPVHFAIRPGYSFPSYVHHRDAEGSANTVADVTYGLESPGEGVKVGLDATYPVPDLAARTLDVSEEWTANAAAYAREWLPGADTSVSSAVTCLFTVTDDNHFILDRRGPVVIASACSGHGFKFTPIIGRLVADLALGGKQSTTEWRLPA